MDKFNKLDEESQIKFIMKLAKSIEKYVNNDVFNELQVKEYNSKESEYKIRFKQEIIAISGLWIAKKKYVVNVIDNEGTKPEEPIKVTGLEVVRGDTPSIVKDPLKHIIKMILNNATDTEIYDQVVTYKEMLKTVHPSEIARNVSCKNTKQYVNSEFTYIKGTPNHIKAWANYHALLKKLNLENKYPALEDDSKASIVYLLPNKWGYSEIAFTYWPEEFNDILQVDYKKLIKTNFENKIKLLLAPMNREKILDFGAEAAAFDYFFG